MSPKPGGTIGRLEASALSRSRTGGAVASAVVLAGTASRVVAMPVVMALILGRSYTAAAVVFLVGASTDFLDGRLARRLRVTSRLGAFLDTTADKLLVTGALIALVSVSRASPWLAMVIIARELTMLGLRAAVAAQGSLLETSLLGKWKATVQFIAIALVILRPEVRFGGAFLDQWLLALAALVTVSSAVDYFVRFAAALRARA